MQRINEPNIPNEAELHAFTEGELSAVEEQALMARLAGQAKALRGLELLRADREMLQGVVDPEPPEGLIADCLAQVERDLLIAEDPMAPAIEFTHPRQRARFRRLAVAASFVLIVGVGGVLIFKNVLVAPDPIQFGPTATNDADGTGTLAAEDGDGNGVGESERVVEDVNTDGDGGSTLLANSEAAIGGSEGSGAHESVVVEDDLIAAVPPTRVVVNPELSDTQPMRMADAELIHATVEPALSADVGLVVQLSALDRGSALERLRALVNESKDGTALIYNVPSIDTSPSDRNFEFTTDPTRLLTDSANEFDQGESDSSNQIALPGGASGSGGGVAGDDRDRERTVSATEYQLALVPLAEQYV